MTAAKTDIRFVRKTYSLTNPHIYRLDRMAMRAGVNSSDKIRRMIDAEWKRLKMDAWEEEQRRDFLPG